MPGAEANTLWVHNVQTVWKPVLLFGTDAWTPPPRWTDSFTVPLTPARTQVHPWGQEVAGFRQLCARFTQPGMRVCDPCCGGGAVGVAAIAAQCHFLGIEIVPAMATAAAARLHALCAESGGQGSNVA